MANADPDDIWTVAISDLGLLQFCLSMIGVDHARLVRCLRLGRLHEQLISGLLLLLYLFVSRQAGAATQSVTFKAGG